jgi:hypothetical protein
MRHRRAWTPRLWPMLAVTAPTVVVVVNLVQPPVWGAIAIGLGLALIVANVRWTIWRHRHPVISHAEFITDLIRDQRESARWN